MMFSLVLATLGRTGELARLLESLQRQSLPDFELVVVDQNPDERLGPVLEPFKGLFSILHLRTIPGQSTARNLGLRSVRGELIAFPDDDCWYPDDLLAQVAGRLEAEPGLDGLTGRSLDPAGVPIARFAARAGAVSRLNAWERTSAVSLFARSEAVRQVGGFDEALGLGAKTGWRGGEDIDLAIRLVQQGRRLYYDPGLAVYHPANPPGGSLAARQRAREYGAGIGRVWRKHRFPIWLVAYYLARPLGGAALALARLDPGRAGYHWASLSGRWQGWRADG